MLRPSRPFFKRSLLVLAGAIAPLVLSASGASADQQPVTIRPATSWKTKFGVESGRQLLPLSKSPEDHADGVERLGTSENAQAIDALIDSLDLVFKGDGLERLMAVRVLRDHVDRPEVREYLIKELTASTTAKAYPFGPLLRASAALALARWGDDKCTEALLGAIAAHGLAFDSARAALLAYPPRSIDVFLYQPDTSDTSDADDKADAKSDKDKTAKDRSDKDKPDTSEKDKPKDAAKDTKAPAKDKSSKAGDDKNGDKTGAKSDEAKDPNDDAPPKGFKYRTLHPYVIDLIGELGDLRFIPALRRAATGTTTGHSAAGLALARFGDETALGDARTWASTIDDPKVVETGTRILVLLDDWSDPTKEAKSEKVVARPAPKGTSKEKATRTITVKGPPAVKGVAKLLSTASTSRTGFELLLSSKSPAKFAPLVEALTAIAHEPTGDDRSLAVMCLARIVGAEKFAPWLDDATVDRVAAFALATLPGEEATTTIGNVIASAKTPAKQRLAVRAGVVRAVAMGVTIPSLSDAIDALAKSREAADIDTVAFAKVALGAEVSSVLGKSPSVWQLAGAARASALRGDEGLKAFVPMLTGAEDGDDPSATHIAAGVGLLTPEGRATTPQKTLLAWTEGGGPLAPLAAMALPSHDDDTLRARITTLLTSGTDPVIRAHIALGLADDPEPSSVSLLTEAYMNETAPNVRRAIVRALALRTEPQRMRVLEWAADLDPDETNRAVARLALKGVAPSPPSAIDLTLSWTVLKSTSDEAEAIPARFVRADGLAIPVFAAEDGDLLVPTQPFAASALNAFPDAAVSDKTTEKTADKPDKSAEKPVEKPVEKKAPDAKPSEKPDAKAPK